MHCLRWVPLLAGLLLVSACTPEPGDSSAKAKRRRAATRVEVAVLALQPLQPQLTRSATLEPRLQVSIFNQEDGLLTELLPYEGDSVEQGEVLARLDDRLLRAELAKAEATLHQARQDLKRLESLVKRKMVADEAIERARTAVTVAAAELSLLRTRLDYTIIRAPFSGVIAARLVEPGDVLARFSHLLTLNQPSPLVAKVAVSELWLPRLAVGDTASMRIDALPDTEFSAAIGRIHPGVDPSSLQGVVEVLLEPVPPGARPGQFCRVTFSGPEYQALMLPFASLQYDSEGEYVMRVDADDKVRRVAVETRGGIGDRVEVVSGLAAGDRVVVRGLLGLKDGRAVQIVPVAPPAAESPASPATPSNAVQ